MLLKPKRKLFAVLFVAACCIIYFSSPRNTNLTDTATRIADTGEPEHRGWKAYFWLSGRELMFFRDIETIPSDDTHPGLRRWEAFRFDVESKVEMPLENLNATIARLQPNPPYDFALIRCRLSPDRKWFAW